MTAIPKHEVTTPAPRKGKRTQPQSEQASPQPIVVTGPPNPLAPFHAERSIQHDINHVAGLAGIEESLDCLARAVARLTSDEHDISLSTGWNTQPVKITLACNDQDDELDRVITAFERIADSVAKLAGLNRPRLEQWHEQDEYEPRYKDVACDGGAPGPAKKVG
jgi:hypothetical protein